jgi:putative Mn2+ efflux pump MntP
VKQGLKSLFKSFSVEFLIYSALVVGYFLLVLHFLGDRLNQLFHHERKTYAAVALLLIVGQGVLLEWLTRFLVRVVGKSKTP